MKLKIIASICTFIFFTAIYGAGHGVMWMFASPLLGFKPDELSQIRFYIVLLEGCAWAMLALIIFMAVKIGREAATKETDELKSS